MAQFMSSGYRDNVTRIVNGDFESHSQLHCLGVVDYVSN